MDFNELLPELLTVATTIVSAFVACKTSVAKCEVIIEDVRDEIKSLKQEINKIYDLDKRISLIENKINNK